jgi:sugar lactone lactonase YvrE
MNNLLRSHVSLFREARSIIAESIWWDGRDALRWCDIDAGAIHTSPVDGAVSGSDDRIIELPAPVTAFQPSESPDQFVFAGADYVGIAREGTGAIARLAEFDHHSARVRFNEAKCDPAGRFIVGSMNLDGDPDGAIYSVDEFGTVTTVIGGIGVANGFEWSGNGDTMWFTDTSTQTIYSGDYSSDGELSNVRPFVHGRMSDGLTRDTDGGFWNGIYDAGHVVHWDANGTKDLEFDVPAGHVTSVGFGGADLSILFIATARENLTEQQLEAQPLTGSIFQVETATHGFPVRSFGTARKGN